MMLRVSNVLGRARRIAPLHAPRRWYNPPMGNATPEEISETQLQVGRVLKTLGVGWLMYKSYQIACGSGTSFTGDARCACMPWTHDAHALGLLLSRHVPNFSITRAGALQKSCESRDRYMACASLAFGRSRVARGRSTGRCRGAARGASERAARDAPHSPRAAYSHGARGQRADTAHRQRRGLPRHRELHFSAERRWCCCGCDALRYTRGQACGGLGGKRMSWHGGMAWQRRLRRCP